MTSGKNIRQTQVDTEISESRREFFEWCGRALAGITIVGVAAPILQGCETSRVLGAGAEITVSVAQLDADGKALRTKETGRDGKRVLIVRRSATDYLALSMECTHLQCEVAEPVGGVMTCPCHGSQYDLSGKVRQGPAIDPLRNYTLTYDAATNTVTVKLT